MTAAAALDPYGLVVGQPEAVAALRAAARNPVHAYLLRGSRGAGARQLARAFAAELLSDGLPPEEAERAQRLALQEKHPDLHVVERTGASIPIGDKLNPEVGSARWIVRESAKAPVEGSRQVFVLLDFHLVQQAGPALLKAIEEPNPSTVFVVVAESVPPELVPIASRCVRIGLRTVSDDDVVAALVGEGHPEPAARAAAEAAAGDLDRARLLASDERLTLRRQLWYSVPEALDGTGATVWRLVAGIRSMIDDAQAPLEAQQVQEQAELEARIEEYGLRGAGKKELVERHRREVRRLRTDEVRMGLAALAARYRDELASGRVSGATARPLVASVAAIDDANEALIRNPNEALLLQALFLRLAPVTAS